MMHQEELVQNLRPKTIIFLRPVVKSSHEENPKELNDFLLRQEEKHDHLEKVIAQLRLKWKHLSPRESKLPAWILFSLFLLTSIILWCKLVLGSFKFIIRSFQI